MSRELEPIPVEDISIKWDKDEKVSPVKDQSMFGSSWAFSTIQAVESAHTIKSGKINIFSPQELVDCYFTI